MAKNYTPEERKEKTALIVRALGFGLTFKQSCQLANLPYDTGKNWTEDYLEFREQVEAIKSKNLEDLSSQMHILAKNGNYQALSFLLSKSPESPFRDGATHLTDAEIDAMEQVMAYLCDNGGLLPVPDSNINPFLKKVENK